MDLRLFVTPNEVAKPYYPRTPASESSFRDMVQDIRLKSFFFHLETPNLNFSEINMFEDLNAILAKLRGQLKADTTSPSQQRRSSTHHHGSSRSQSRHHPHRPRSHTSGHNQGHRNKGRPLTSQPTSSNSARDYDLDLKSLWFAKSPPSFPPPSMNRDGKLTYASSSGWSSSGVRRTHTFTAHVRNTVTLASSKIHLIWDASNPGLTVKAEQRHDPPPRKLSQSELESYRERYANCSCIVSIR
jgi:hypothetical protein